ncbi:MAG: hydantoinase B/oxoprolinase family protein, partial [Bacillota bacterium]|nr:hydantoinase B/oxoprolinase family protein [Bacillota bacterium]
MKEDPVTLEIFKHLYQAVAEEMGETLRRTGFSPNIKERRDYSCAVFDGDRKTIAQAEHMPVHLGSMPRSVEAAVKAFTFAPGDGVVLNDPYRGGTHLPDITLVQGVFCPGEGKPLFYVANRAHHADVGGMSPGSLPLASELYQEGIIIPPVRLMKEGELQEDVLALLLRNVRTPDERRGDLLAQLAANAVGARRLLKYVEDEGREKVLFYGKALQDYAERMTRALISELPDGHYHFEDYLDGDGRGREDVALRLTLTIQGDEAILDFRESDPQVEGSINAVRAITESASFYAFRAAIPEAIPSNEGGFRPLTILTRPGTILDALPPAAVSAGNVETSQRTVDVVLGALSQALPQRIPAAGQGTMNNITFGGKDRQ